MEVVDILREGVGVALRIGAPLLILSMLGRHSGRRFFRR